MSAAFVIFAIVAAVAVAGAVSFAFFLRRARRLAAGFDLPSVLSPLRSEQQSGWQQADQPDRVESLHPDASFRAY